MSTEPTFDGPLLADRWRLGPRLGAGAQAHTYLARDEADPDERIVVVKQLVLAAKSNQTWKNYDLFQREIRTLASLKHPGVPRFIESFESDPGVFNLVMERAPGATLRSWSARHRLGADDLRDILRRALEILVYLHGRSPPVVHRDIKPANLLRDRDGTVSLVDFGGVRDALRSDGGSTMIGTFGYMAPEQLHGQSSPATDIYGLGATIIAVAGGIEPEQVPRKGLRMDLERHLPNLDPELRRLLAAMTEPDPDERPNSAAELLERLDALGTGKGKRKGKAKQPSRQSPQAMVQARDTPGAAVVQRATGDIAEFTRELPVPLRFLMHIMLFSIGMGGMLSLAIIRYAALPILFALISAATGDGSRRKLDRARHLVYDGFEEGIGGFGALAMGRSASRRQLPPAE